MSIAICSNMDELRKKLSLLKYVRQRKANVMTPLIYGI